MSMKQGSLSIDSENIFPIIKKWLYSDHDIFLRELISNGCDAITKLKKLDIMGEYDLPDDFDPSIQIEFSAENKTLKITDNGLGMTADEVEEYINQIAFSGATDFIEKYKDKSNDDQIIGHFGLGFYSSFMVADEVYIDTLSWQDGAAPVHWECDGGTVFSMDEGSKDSVGTTITLFLNEDCLEFANEYRLREVIEKYCSFMPYPIYLNKENAEPEYETILPEEKTDKDTVVETIIEEAKTEERENENGEKEIVEISPKQEKLKILKRPVPLNDTEPLWAKQPSACTDEEYKEFYRKVFRDFKEPLFWIHLNMDYPFNLKGILYFPKINLRYEAAEGTIKLYNNQVFIADNIKEVIPDFLMLLKGVIDCPDLPLNVSRSALQNDGFVTKISEYITKKVADKLSGLCKTEKENYEKYWSDIAPFIKFGCLRDPKFCDRMNDYILFENLDGKFLTLPELLAEKEEADTEEGASADEAAADGAQEDSTAAEDAAEQTEDDAEPDKETVYYVSDRNQQGQYIRMFKEQGMDAVILDSDIDASFITQLEQRNEHYQFMRIDADVTDALKDESNTEDLSDAVSTLQDAFKSALSNEKLTVRAEALKDESIASVLTISEEGHRIQEMMRMYQYGSDIDTGMFGADETITLNVKHPLVSYILEHKDSENVPIFCQQLYDLAKIANQPLTPDEMNAFVKRSNEIMLMITK